MNTLVDKEQVMSDWNGIERRNGEQHKGILPECLEVFKRLETKIDDLKSTVSDKVDMLNEKVDGLKDRADKINGRYDDHIKTSERYRGQVDVHDSQIKGIIALKRWWWGAILTIILFIIGGVMSFIFVWGAVSNQVNINTSRLNAIEQIHPRK